MVAEWHNGCKSQCVTVRVIYYTQHAGGRFNHDKTPYQRGIYFHDPRAQGTFTKLNSPYQGWTLHQRAVYCTEQLKKVCVRNKIHSGRVPKWQSGGGSKKLCQNQYIQYMCLCNAYSRIPISRTGSIKRTGILFSEI